MCRATIVCGPTGAGKTTHSIVLCDETNAIRFSIDPWMQTLFAKDMGTLDFAWMMERVERCQDQIWSVGEQVLARGGNVVLDLGFTTRAQRRVFVERATLAGVPADIHYLDAPSEVRRRRVASRNAQKDPRVYAFDVTDPMFAFMEPRFEVPDESELADGKLVAIADDGTPAGPSAA